MKLCKMSGRRASLLLASLLAGAGILSAADDATTSAVPQSPTAGSEIAAQSQSDEIARLKAALAEQQKQLQALQQVLQNQQQLIERAVGTSATAAAPASPQHASLGTVASLSPVIPAPAPLPVSIASAPASGSSGWRWQPLRVRSRHQCRSTLFTPRQRLHRSGRLYGFHAILAR